MPVKASPTDQAKLLELQSMDTRIRQIDYAVKTLPDSVALASLESNAAALRGELLSATGALEDAQHELGRIESDVALVETRIARDSGRLQASTSVKDVAGLESELAGLRRRQLALEEIELEVMERVEGLETAARDLRARNDDLKTRVSEVGAARDDAVGVLTTERAGVDASRSTIAGSLPGDLMALYERQLSRYGSGASLLRGGVSGASGVKLNESDMAAIRAANPDDVLLCPDSNAILVRTSESGL